MKYILFILAIALVNADAPPELSFESWVHYAEDFGRQYDTSDETVQEQYYTNAYKTNFDAIYDFENDETNEATYLLGQTEYSDVSSANFLFTYLFKPLSDAYPDARILVSDGAISVDWSEAFKATSNQVDDNSWAFAAVKAVEAFYNKDLQSTEWVSLSVQQIIDCASLDGAESTPYSALQWISENGIDLDSTYVDGNCEPTTQAYQIPAVRVVQKDKEQLKAALQFTPVTVCFDISTLQQYVGGIVNQDITGDANYCGLLYGFQKDENDVEYWTIQTSLNSNWGINGAIYISSTITTSIIQYAAFPMNINQDIEYLRPEFYIYKLHFNKQYDDTTENQYRFQVYAYAVQDNANVAYFGETQFTDLTQTEFSDLYLLSDISFERQRNINIETDSNFKVDNIDWRNTQGFVSDVQNQDATCKNSWAASAKSALESYFRQQTSKANLSVSLQQLIDCAVEDALTGCDGGSLNNALQFIQQFGVTWTSKYAYSGEAQECALESGPLRPSNIYQLENANGISTALARRPVSVCFDVSLLQNYKQGTIAQTDCNGTANNHCGLLVGQTDTYWIVQATFGTTWGNNGYIYIAYGTNCGIEKNAFLIE